MKQRFQAFLACETLTRSKSKFWFSFLIESWTTKLLEQFTDKMKRWRRSLVKTSLIMAIYILFPFFKPTVSVHIRKEDIILSLKLIAFISRQFLSADLLARFAVKLVLKVISPLEPPAFLLSWSSFRSVEERGEERRGVLQWCWIADMLERSTFNTWVVIW